MSVKIRLKRMGAKGKPFYRVVVADSRSPRDGRFIETLGYYDPLTDPATVKIDEEKALKWMGRGAQPTDTAAALLKKQGVTAKFLAAKAGTAAPVEVEVVVEKKKAAPRKKKTETATEQVAAEPEAQAVAVEPEAAVEEQPAEAQE